MIEQLIDLSSFPNGVTLDVNFNFTGSVAPFPVFILSQDKQTIYYSRMFNTPVLQINLPKHSPKVFLLSGAPIKSILFGPIRIYKIKYKFNNDIIEKRNYGFDKIKVEYLPFIPDQFGRPTNQPARFMPTTGLIQYSDSVLKTYPEPVVAFIQEHEPGHYYYGRDLPPQKLWPLFSPEAIARFKQIHAEDEAEADRFAFYNLINRGYNFSGTWQAVDNYLSDNPETRYRRQQLKNTIINEHKNLSNEWN